MNNNCAPSFALASFSEGTQPPFLGMVVGDRVLRVAELGLDLPGGDNPTLFALLQDWEKASHCSALWYRLKSVWLKALMSTSSGLTRRSLSRAKCFARVPTIANM